MRLFRAAEAIACASSQRGEALERIITHVGASARRRREISARDIELFTEMTGDRTPIHYDDDLAGDAAVSVGSWYKVVSRAAC